MRAVAREGDACRVRVDVVGVRADAAGVEGEDVRGAAEQGGFGHSGDGVRTGTWL